MNVNSTAGLFTSILWTKLFAVVFPALSSLGAKGVKDEKITLERIIVCLTVGFVLFFFNWWLLALPSTTETNATLYIFHGIRMVGK